MIEGNLLILGSAGHVARGLLQILNNDIEFKDIKIYGLDSKQKGKLKYYQKLFPNLDMEVIQGNYNYFDMDKLIREHNIHWVVNLIPDSAVPVWDACEKQDWKVNYLDGSIFLDDKNLLYKDAMLLSNFYIFDDWKRNWRNVKGLISCGMNPGNVNYFYQYGVKKHGVEGLKAIYIIEQDTIGHIVHEDDDTFYITWSGVNALAELGEEYPAYYKDGIPYIVGQIATQTKYGFHLRNDRVWGHLVSHEEVYNISKRYPWLESAFIYGLREDISKKVNLIISGEKIFKYYKIFDCMENPVKGTDKVGVLLVYKDREVAIFNEMDNNVYTTGTIFQVSIGIYIGLKTLIKFSDKINNLDWLDIWLNDPEIYNYYGEKVKELMWVEEEVHEYSEGFLEERKYRNGKI